jgi:transposase-like protein
MKKTQYSKEFKAKIAIEALKGEKTIQELAQIHGVHPNLIGQWKKHLLENASSTFDKNKKDIEKIETEKKMELLYGQIGMLQVEKEFLKKKYRQLYGTEPEL